MGNFLAFRIIGELSDRETEEIGRCLGNKIAQVGKVRILLFVDHYPSLLPAESLYYDLRFATLHADGIDRLAVVGEKARTETWVAIFGLFGGLKTAYFDRSETEQARAWLLASA